MSPQVNLLDWRSEKRARLRQRFRRQLQLSVLAALLLALAADLVLQGAAAEQIRRNAHWQAQRQQLQSQLQTQARLAEQARRWQRDLQQIRTLQQRRAATIRWLEALVQDLPPDAWLLQIDQTDIGLQLQGGAADSAAVAAYLQSLDDSPWFNEAKLRSLREEANGASVHFNLALRTQTEALR